MSAGFVDGVAADAGQVGTAEDALAASRVPLAHDFGGDPTDFVRRRRFGRGVETGELAHDVGQRRVVAARLIHRPQDALGVVGGHVLFRERGGELVGPAFAHQERLDERTGIIGVGAGSESDRRRGGAGVHVKLCQPDGRVIADRHGLSLGSQLLQGLAVAEYRQPIEGGVAGRPARAAVERDLTQLGRRLLDLPGGDQADRFGRGAILADTGQETLHLVRLDRRLRAAARRGFRQPFERAAAQGW